MCIFGHLFTWQSPVSSLVSSNPSWSDGQVKRHSEHRSGTSQHYCTTIICLPTPTNDSGGCFGRLCATISAAAPRPLRTRYVCIRQPWLRLHLLSSAVTCNSNNNKNNQTRTPHHSIPQEFSFILSHPPRPALQASVFVLAH